MRKPNANALSRILPGTTQHDLKTLEARDDMRREASTKFPRLFKRISFLLYRLDVEGIYLSGRGAYENEAAEICLELQHCRTASDVQKLVERVFSEQFGPAEPSKYESIAKELAALL